LNETEKTSFLLLYCYIIKLLLLKALKELGNKKEHEKAASFGDLFEQLCVSVCK